MQRHGGQTKSFRLRQASTVPVHLLSHNPYINHIHLLILIPLWPATAAVAREGSDGPTLALEGSFPLAPWPLTDKAHEVLDGTCDARSVNPAAAPRGVRCLRILGSAGCPPLPLDPRPNISMQHLVRKELGAKVQRRGDPTRQPASGYHRVFLLVAWVRKATTAWADARLWNLNVWILRGMFHWVRRRQGVPRKCVTTNVTPNRPLTCCHSICIVLFKDIKLIAHIMGNMGGAERPRGAPHIINDTAFTLARFSQSCTSPS